MTKSLIVCFRWISTLIVLLGTAPVYGAIWAVWRLSTLYFHRTVYEYGDDVLYSLYQKLVLFFFENCVPVQVMLSGDIDQIRKKENVIFICNHQCTVDWVVADMLAERQGSVGHVRYILKDSLKYMPLYGAYFRQHGSIYVRRSGHFRSDQAGHQLDSLASTSTPFWMVVFPEGTRYNPDLKQVITKSQSFAVQNGMPVLDHVLTPRPKALKLCIDRLRSRVDAVYDVTLAYSSTRQVDDGGRALRVAPPTLSSFISGVCTQLHVHVQRIPIASIPDDSCQFNDWLVGRFVEKEKLLKQFYCDDQQMAGMLSSSNSGSNCLPLFETLPAVIFWVCLLAVLWLTSFGFNLYITMCIVGTLISLGWAIAFS